MSIAAIKSEFTVIPGTRRELLIKRYQFNLDGIVAKQSKFVAAFLENPAAAMGWADPQFQLASERALNESMIHWLRTGASKQSIQDMLTDAALTGGRYVASSTSHCGNLMKQYNTAATVETLARFKHEAENLDE